jgi:hypothetical protein
MYTSRDVASIMLPLYYRYEALAPGAFILLRGDSGFATPELYELIEAQNRHYVIRLKSIARLQALTQAIANEQLDSTSLDKRQVYVTEIVYHAKSWTRESRVVIQMEKPAGELLFNFTYIITNLELDPEDMTKSLISGLALPF